MGCDKIVIDMHVGFSGEIMFWQMGCDIYIYIYICVCVCEMWFVIDVAIEDFNWYVMILIIMMMLLIKTMSTWIDFIVDDYVNMKWGCCGCW